MIILPKKEFPLTQNNNLVSIQYIDVKHGLAYKLPCSLQSGSGFVKRGEREDN